MAKQYIKSVSLNLLRPRKFSIFILKIDQFSIKREFTSTIALEAPLFKNLLGCRFGGVSVKKSSEESRWLFACAILLQCIYIYLKVLLLRLASMKYIYLVIQ